MTFLLVQRPPSVAPVGLVGWDNRAPSTPTTGTLVDRNAVFEGCDDSLSGALP